MTATAGPAPSDRARAAFLDALVHDDPVALYESAPCGFVTTTPDGVVVKSNATFRRWVGRDAADLVGEVFFADLLAVGSRIYYGTHLGPALLMSDLVQEVALDLLTADGGRLPVLANASLARGEDGRPRAIRIALFDATERRSYERELVEAKRRAEESEREAQALARALQQTLIPPTPPQVPGLDLAATYLPAGQGSEVGGDFYDVFKVRDDDWVITLGDVCGKGYEAAVVTSLVRHTIRALSVNEPRPSAVLSALDEVLHHDPTDRFCTAVLLRLRRVDGRWEVTLGLAGHPQPLLLRADGVVQPLGRFGPLLGVLDRPAFTDTTVGLEPGDVVVLYTDGVTEALRDGTMYGEERLVDAVGRIGPVPADLVVALPAAVLAYQDGDTVRDDVAVLAFGPPAGSQG
ncbi:SpoIIE family protein phosphatase [Nocardioides anomalus]|uniref:SpoIIE family protein phosphatase n=1 Tax=Nocardioides anomalus TaxID=2712223 RepID=A0A6G6WAC7_9ACTN|nr:SpoIIE family protein phosphatase [Nocardioides anomalus]QIG42301.1 SpoIIE family protein phosphatase [Nocardioides anomalus]